jgi:hypothetical protein
MRTRLLVLILVLASCHSKQTASSPYSILSHISVDGKVQMPIYDAQGKTDSLLVFRIKETGDYIAAVAFQDSDRADVSELYLFRVKDSTVEPMHFYYGNGQFYDYLVAWDNFTVVDTIGRAIYCKTMRNNDDTIETANVSKYVWQPDSGRFSLSAEKTLPLSVQDHPASVGKYF